MGCRGTGREVLGGWFDSAWKTPSTYQSVLCSITAKIFRIVPTLALVRALPDKIVSASSSPAFRAKVRQEAAVECRKYRYLISGEESKEKAFFCVSCEYSLVHRTEIIYYQTRILGISPLVPVFRREYIVNAVFESM